MVKFAKVGKSIRGKKNHREAASQKNQITQLDPSPVKNVNKKTPLTIYEGKATANFPKDRMRVTQLRKAETFSNTKQHGGRKYIYLKKRLSWTK